MDKHFVRALGAVGAILGGTSPAARAQSPFATRVVAYEPAPGQQVNNPLFNNPAAALGAPVGGSLSAPDNSKVVTLGGFGGSITLGFDHPIRNQPPTAANPRGLDFIVYGNAFYVNGNPLRRWAEAGVVEVSADANGNGLADDPWHVIPGTHLGARPSDRRSSQTWDDNPADPQFPPALGAWVPAGRSGRWTTTAFELPASVFAGPVVVNLLGGPGEMAWGYADCTPTLALGDADGDGVADDPAALADSFYTKPTDPMMVGVEPGRPGGDAIDIGWAVDPQTGLAPPGGLSSIDFVRITTAVNSVNAILGERSTEISGVAEVRLGARADFNGDGLVDPDDLADFVACFFSGGACSRADFNGDGVVDPDDLADFIAAFFG